MATQPLEDDVPPDSSAPSLASAVAVTKAAVKLGRKFHYQCITFRYLSEQNLCASADEIRWMEMVSDFEQQDAAKEDDAAEEEASYYEEYGNL